MPVVILQLAPILHIAKASVAVIATQVLAQTVQKASEILRSLATGSGNSRKNQQENHGESYYDSSKSYLIQVKLWISSFPLPFCTVWGLYTIQCGEIHRWTSNNNCCYSFVCTFVGPRSDHRFALLHYLWGWFLKVDIPIPYPHLDSILCFNMLQPLQKQQTLRREITHILLPGISMTHSLIERGPHGHNPFQLWVKDKKRSPKIIQNLQTGDSWRPPGVAPATSLQSLPPQLQLRPVPATRSRRSSDPW